MIRNLKRVVWFPLLLEKKINNNNATKEEIEKWREEDYWNKMDFNPAWIFVLPTVVVLSALAVAYFIGHYIIPMSEMYK